MANKIKQFRYYNDTNNLGKNSPSVITIDGADVDVSYAHYVSGAVFGECFPGLQFGIQSLPGTKFYLNNSYLPIVIGYTGIYELDVDDLAEITSLRFDNESLNKIKNNPETYLIIDIIYEKGDNEE